MCQFVARSAYSKKDEESCNNLSAKDQARVEVCQKGSKHKSLQFPGNNFQAKEIVGAK